MVVVVWWWCSLLAEWMKDASSLYEVWLPVYSSRNGDRGHYLVFRTFAETLCTLYSYSVLRRYSRTTGEQIGMTRWEPLLTFNRGKGLTCRSPGVGWNRNRPRSLWVVATWLYGSLSICMDSYAGWWLFTISSALYSVLRICITIHSVQSILIGIRYRYWSKVNTIHGIHRNLPWKTPTWDTPLGPRWLVFLVICQFWLVKLDPV